MEQQTKGPRASTQFRRSSTIFPSNGGPTILGCRRTPGLLLPPLHHEALCVPSNQAQPPSLYRLSTGLGPLFHIRLGSVPLLVASDAATARELLRDHELFFSDRQSSKAISHLTYGGRSFLFAPYGDYWRFMKKLCMSELLGGRMLEQLQGVRRDEIGTLLEMLQQKAERGEKMDVGAALTRLTNNVICGMTMEGVKRMVKETVALIGTPNVADYVGICNNLDLQHLKSRYEDVHRRFDSLMERILKEEDALRTKKSGKTGADGVFRGLLHVLLDISEDEGAEMRLSRENIKSFIHDLFMAGTDTTSVTMEWALAELINNPAILQDARREIDSVVGGSRLVEEPDIQNLPFLQAIVKETLRLHPALPILPRQSNAPCKFRGYNIPADTGIAINVWAIGRDPNQWENPLEFRPERFTAKGQSFGIDVRGQHYHFLPFGSGRRRCPGLSLALQLIHTTLANVIHCFDLSVEGEVVDMTEGYGATLSRVHPLVCTPKARLTPVLSTLAISTSTPDEASF
ncbi:unnamed protein product [Spirodela intermedia]|uniref:Uncharacterized protein n=1 Tax=Spirodela intermedia TaxID=51605 RepID=A0A7I8IKV6_SPIIN|nr:unnamed protein product [Spirodela intermedia]CAA6658524.1 unnamed protein product [Spirodela intermedia]